MKPKTRSVSNALFQLAVELKNRPTVILSPEDYNEIFNDLLSEQWRIYEKQSNYQKNEFIAYGILIKRSEMEATLNG